MKYDISDLYACIKSTRNMELLEELSSAIEEQKEILSRPVPEDKFGEQLYQNDWVVHCGRVKDGPFQVKFTSTGTIKNPFVNGPFDFLPSMLLKTYTQNKSRFKMIP